MEYAVSLGAGLAVGVMYGLLRVRTPAPPLVCLVGLAGMLIGYGLLDSFA
ncbi:DUF1427 family protein [Streptomyces sp. NPDC088354]|nr:DUF1427 family protein [Streptomyces sp. MI02-7b]MDX3072852.1 DUF1427 family protein [Streptomyces sp. MI02-7b]